MVCSEKQDASVMVTTGDNTKGMQALGKKQEKTSPSAMWLCARFLDFWACVVCLTPRWHFLSSTVPTIAYQEVGKVLEFSFLSKKRTSVSLHCLCVLSSFQDPTVLWPWAFARTALAPCALTAHVHTKPE